MDLIGESGLQRVVPLSLFKSVGGYKTLDVLAATIGKGGAEWRAEAKNKIIYVNFHDHSIASCSHETDIGARCDPIVVGGYAFLDKDTTPPSTQQIINFMRWKIDEDQIIEFYDY